MSTAGPASPHDAPPPTPSALMLPQPPPQPPPQTMELSHNTATTTTTTSTAAAEQPFYAYCLDRGNGMYTRLVPADMLPPMLNLPPLLASCHGMKIVPDPPLQAPPVGVVASSFSSSSSSSSLVLPRGGHQRLPLRYPMHYGAMPPGPPGPPPQPISAFGHHPRTGGGKKNKVYCSKWVHDGTCAFTQQGCKYKHEMPHDTKTQHELGLFQGYPAWYKKWQHDLQVQAQIQQAQAQVQAQVQQAQVQQPSSTDYPTTTAEMMLSSPLTPLPLPPLPPPPPRASTTHLASLLPPTTPVMVRSHHRFSFSQPTPPFSATSTTTNAGSSGGFYSYDGDSSGSTRTPQTAPPWPSPYRGASFMSAGNQLAETFGRSLTFNEPGSDSNSAFGPICPPSSSSSATFASPPPPPPHHFFSHETRPGDGSSFASGFQYSSSSS